MADVKILAGSSGICKEHHEHHEHHHEHHDHAIEADYVIVGLGTAGAVLARFLSDQIDGEFKNSVVVIEAGSNFTTGGDPADRARVAQGAPSGDTTIASDPKFSSYQLMGTGEAAPGSLAYTGGRLWGGGSSHNDMQSVRSTPNVYDDWATLSGNAQWSYSNLLPFMKFMEGYLPNGTTPDLAQRGLTGALSIAQDPPLGADPGFAVLQAAIASGANA
jgi:choline dehydrogenase-like flavoprotein